MEFLALWIIDFASAFKTFTINNSFSEQELYDAVVKDKTETLKGLLQNRQEKNPIIVKDEVNGKKTLYTKFTLKFIYSEPLW
jgi:hypothetical protein